MTTLRDLILDSWDNVSSFTRLVKNKEFLQKLKEETKFLDEKYPNIRNKHRAYVIKNNIKEIPLCKCGCGLHASLNQSNPKKGFRDYYNNQHSLNNKVNSDKKKLLTKENLYNERIILKNSIKDISKTIGVSEVTIRSSLKEFNLDLLFDGRQKNLNANKILQDKNQLIDFYNSGFTMYEIAEKLNTTKSTISRWFSIHNIDAKSPNSYERKIKKISSQEQQIYNWLSEFYKKEIIQSNRAILNGKELDIYLPENKLAIEYNGLYSHLYRPWETNDSLIKGPKYHLNKTLQCESKNIQLLHFFSDEWLYKKDIVKSIIKSKLGLTSKIYARKCKIIEVDISTKNKFLNNHHIQGEDKSKIKLGLIYNDNLVSIMTFSRSRFNSNYKWELSRFSCIKGVTVVGGFSKLLSHFRKSNTGNIVSYADRRISNGNVYFKNGFKLIKINRPSYFYVDKNCLERFNRMKFQKKLIGATTSTEYERAREMGYEKIWDCGTLCFGLH